MNHYDTLGVEKGADQVEITKAYRRKAQKMAPRTDAECKDPARSKALVALNRAYDTLGDPQKRKHYDETGQDGPAPGLPENKARELILQLFAQCIERLPDTVDPMPAIKASIAKTQDMLRMEGGKIRALIEKLEKKRKRVKYRGKDRNFIVDMIDKRIADAKLKLTEADSAVAVGDIAMKLVDDFEFEVEPMTQPSQHPFFVAMFSGNGP